MKTVLKTIVSIACMIASATTLAQTKFESLNFLMSIQGQQIVSGQHNDQKNLDCGASGSTGPRYWTDQVHAITGKYPGLWGGDMLFHGSDQLRWDMTYEAERQWNSGAIVNIMWHACPPTQGASCQWSGGLLSSLTAQQFAELLTDGSNLNTIWKQRVDEIAVHLEYLKNAGVEVFWRPYHEQNQTAFWWNSQGPQNTQRLWRMMHDYMTNDLGLDNLIWVWDIQDLGTGYANWNPGNQYWDVLALDIYADGFNNNRYYNDMVSVATPANKLIAIGECFNLPSDQHLTQYPLYTFFMNWAYGLKKWYAPDCRPTNSDDYIRQVYNNPKVITLDEMPGWGKNKAPNNIAANKTVTVSSTEVGNNIGANAVDRNYGTRWSSLYSADEWLAIDLAGLYELDSVKIKWEAAMAVDYQLQTSSDGVSWTTISTVSNNVSLDNKLLLNKELANHIRILGTTRATVYGYSIYEVEVYGQRKATAYNGTAVVIPAKIEAEDFDLGGEGVAYQDLSASNTHGAYRLSEGVDIEACTDLGGGFNLGGTQATEWTGYQIDVQQATAYDFNFRVATTAAGKSMHLEVNGVDISGSIALPNTGGWQDWETVTIPSVQLEQGVQQLRIIFDSELINLNYFEISMPVITGISALNRGSNFIVWPNPTNGMVNYRFSNPTAEILQVEIYDAVGNLLAVHPTNQSTGRISLSGNPAGSYIVKVVSNQGQESTLLLFIP